MNNVDTRIVELEFNNKEFEQNIQQSLKSLDELKKGLELDQCASSLRELERAANDFSLDGIESEVSKIGDLFGTLGGMLKMSFLGDFANKIENWVKSTVKALTIDPITSGFEEFETQTNAVQTILNNVLGDYGYDDEGRAKALGDINAALNELNLYADKTIYNFTHMTTAIGRFAASGVKLESSVAATKGISNLAAFLGATPENAQSAYNMFAQAISAGHMSSYQWNSLRANKMIGKQFEDALIRTATNKGATITVKETGKNKKGKQVTEEKTYSIADYIAKVGDIKSSLEKGWLTDEILLETLKHFSGEMSADELEALHYSQNDIKEILRLGQEATDAATEVKTATQLMDTLKEAAQSGWTQTWQTIIGDYEEAKQLWTGVSKFVGGILDGISSRRNEMLQDWKDHGGRDSLILSLSIIRETLEDLFKSAKAGFKEFFPSLTSENLLNFTFGIQRALASIRDWVENAENAEKIRLIFAGIGSAGNFVLSVLKELWNIFAGLFTESLPLSGSLLDISAIISDLITKVNDVILGSETWRIVWSTLSTVINSVVGFVSRFVGMNTGKAFEAFGILKDYFSGKNNLSDTFNNLTHIGFSKNWAQGLIEFAYKIKNFGGKVPDIIKNIGDKISGLFSNIKEWANKKDIVGTLTSWLISIDNGIPRVIGWFIKFIKSIKDFFTNSEKFQKAFGKIKNAFGTASNWVGTKVDEFRDKFAKFAEKFDSNGDGNISFGEIFNGIAEKFNSKWIEFKEGLSTFFKTTLPNFFIITVPSWISQAKQSIENNERFQSFVGFLSELWGNIKDSDAYKSVASVLEFLGTVFSSLGESIGAFFSTDTSNDDTLKDKIKHRFEALGTSIVEWWNETGDKFNGTWPKIVSFFDTIRGFFSSIGSFFDVDTSADETLSKKIKHRFKSVSEAIVSWWGETTEKFGPVWTKITKFFELVGGFFSSFGKFFTADTSDDETLKEKIQSRLGAVQYAISEWWSTAKEDLGKVWGNISTFFSGFINETIPGLFSNLFGRSNSNGVDDGKTSGFFGNLFSSLFKKEDIKESSETVDSLNTLFDSYVDAYSEAETIEKESAGASKFLDGFTGFFDGIGDFFQDKGLIGSLKTGLKLFAGVNIIKAIGSLGDFGKGFKALGQGLKAEKTDSIGDIVLKFAEAIGIVAFALSVVCGIDKDQLITSAEVIGGIAFVLGLFAVASAYLPNHIAYLPLISAAVALMFVMNEVSKLIKTISREKLSQTQLDSIVKLLDCVGDVIISMALFGGLISLLSPFAVAGNWIGMALIIAGIAATLWIIIGVIEELGGKLKDTQKLENFNRGLDSLSGVFKKLSLLGRINDVINSLSNFDANVDKLAALADVARAMSEMTTSFSNINTGNFGKVVNAFQGANINSFGTGLASFITQVQEIEYDPDKDHDKISDLISFVNTLSAIDERSMRPEGCRSIVDFGNELVPFSSKLTDFIRSLKYFTYDPDVDHTKISNIIDFAKSLADIDTQVRSDYAANALTRTIGDFGTNVSSFSDGLNKFVEEAINSNYDPQKHKEKIADLFSFADQLAALERKIQPSPSYSLVSKAVKDLGEFSSDIGGFGVGIASFVASCVTANYDYDKDHDKVNSVIKFAQQLASIEGDLPLSGDSLLAAIIGLRSLEAFGGEVKKFGKGMKFFIDEVLKVDNYDENARRKISSIIDIAERLAQLESALTKHGGIKHWFTGDASLDTFAVTLGAAAAVGFASSINAFANECNAINDIYIKPPTFSITDNRNDFSKKVDSVLEIATQLVALENGLAGKEIKIGDFGSGLQIFTNEIISFVNQVSLAGTELNDAGERVEIFNLDRINGVIKIASDIMALEPEIGKTQLTDIRSLAANMPYLADGFSAISNAVSGFSNENLIGDVDAAFGALEEFQTKLDELFGKGGFWKELAETIFKFDENASKNQTNKLKIITDSMASFGKAMKEFRAGLPSLAASGTNVLRERVDAAFADINMFAASMRDNFDDTLSKDVLGKTNQLTLVSNAMGAFGEGYRKFSSAVSGSSKTTANFEQLRKSIMDFQDLANQIQGGEIDVSSISYVAEMLGNSYATALETSMTSNANKTLISTAGEVLANVGWTSSSKTYKSWVTVGGNFAVGLANGIYKYAYLVSAAAWYAAMSGINAARNAMNVHSPSKVAAELGMYWDLGLSQGIDTYANVIEHSSENAAHGAIDSAKGMLAGLSSEMALGMDPNPVIRPVVDLDNVIAGMNSVDGMFSNTRAINADLFSGSFMGRNIDALSYNDGRLDGSSNRDVVSAIAELSDRFNNLSDAVTNMQLVLDSGVLVGRLGQKMDNQLGVLAGRRERGN